MTVRVYDVESNELIATEVIENTNSTYFNRIPRIYLLDDAKTAVVLLGGSINELDTLVSTFTFMRSLQQMLGKTNSGFTDCSYL